MNKFTLSTLSKTELKRFVQLQEMGIDSYDWLNVETLTLTEREQLQLQILQSHLWNYDIHLMNEATIWARGIYPLLLLAERHHVQAWSEVSLTAKYPQFEIECFADGVLGKCVSGFIEAPYLVVVEAKRGLEAQNPLYQLYGELLAAAHLNWENDNQDEQEMFGAYTIADTWKFIRAQVAGIETDRPTFLVEASREYEERTEAETILKILKKIVANRIDKAIHVEPLGQRKNYERLWHST